MVFRSILKCIYSSPLTRNEIINNIIFIILSTNSTMKFIILLTIVLALLAFVSAKPECSFTCSDGTKVTLSSKITTEEHCKLAIELSECPVMKVPVGQHCIPWCYPCNQCPTSDDLEIVSYSFSQ
ncbi:hypothetical protein DFA_08058 [Cavenderia fasciculata]|uniref:Uncharacterized protein n=1 Tax=Cavenderia fasciculata TaxID=261658 RepID=F4Q4X0_CACFS|nr:uncharacterized protein DFA_08058 [Cavenderia fasciculata]EGG17076.1 hypothetical protein DFA_08058 [Cavenderia fasciculata]|eukprot:XP_004355560.1 hypothetical protein DFA_08058 [Cavenderia fasciculata]